MICRKEKLTGNPCKNGYSREISCEYSKTGCLLDCGSKCSHFEPVNQSYNWATYRDKSVSGCITCGGKRKDNKHV